MCIIKLGVKSPLGFLLAILSFILCSSQVKPAVTHGVGRAYEDQLCVVLIYSSSTFVFLVDEVLLSAPLPPAGEKQQGHEV